MIGFGPLLPGSPDEHGGRRRRACWNRGTYGDEILRS
jgi:hypothetical protein